MTVTRSNYFASSELKAAVLVVNPSSEDRAVLRRILSNLPRKLIEVSGCRDALDALRSQVVPVVVCEQRLPDGDWKSVFDGAAALPMRPALIVSSRLADGSLWAEVLNLGGYDVLAKPFHEEEVVRVVSLAFHSWEDTCRRAIT
jgi:DNA-binding NtrC family response regulator